MLELSRHIILASDDRVGVLVNDALRIPAQDLLVAGTRHQEELFALLQPVVRLEVLAVGDVDLVIGRVVVAGSCDDLITALKAMQ